MQLRGPVIAFMLSLAARLPLGLEEYAVFTALFTVQLPNKRASVVRRDFKL